MSDLTNISSFTIAPSATVEQLNAFRKDATRSSRVWLMRVNIAMLLTCLLFLFDGYEPGWSLFTCVSMVLFSALTVAWAIGSFKWFADNERGAFGVLAIMRLAAAPLLAISCAIMVITSVPTRIGLWASHDQLEEMIHSAPTVEGGLPVNRRVGVYDIHRYAADGAGGVYFVTGEYRDTLSKEPVMLGIAFHPSANKSPFGPGEYRLSHVCGDWYTFATSDGE